MNKNLRYEITMNPWHNDVHIAYAISLETAVHAAKRHDCCTGHGCCCGGPAIRNADGTPLSDQDAMRLSQIIWAMRNR